MNMRKKEPKGRDSILPDPQETELARKARDKLITFLQKNERVYEFEISKGNGQKERLLIPYSAFVLFLEILKQMADGNAVAVIHHQGQLTTQEAANFLNVSRPYLIKLLEEGKIPYSKVGKHRRVKFYDIQQYKNNIMLESKKARVKLTKKAQDLDLGY